MKKEIDYLNARTIPKFREGMTYRDIFLTTHYIRFWTFLHKYGERFHLCKKTNDATLEYKGEMGHCIHNSLMICKHYNEFLDERNINDTRIHYVEGLSSERPLSLHAWNVRVDSRHARILDYTWTIEREDVWYQGIMFNTDFYKEINKRQYKENFRNTLPYLSTGASCLTYKPLVYGEIDGFRIKEDDIDEAMVSLEQFIYKYVIKE